MNIQELIKAQKQELTNEHQRISKNISSSNEKLLKTEGALLMLQHLELQLIKED